MSRLSDGDSADTGSSRETIWVNFRRRNFMSTVLTATRYSQVEKARIPTEGIDAAEHLQKRLLCQSSASATSLVICRQTEYTRCCAT